MNAQDIINNAVRHGKVIFASKTLKENVYNEGLIIKFQEGFAENPDKAFEPGYDFNKEYYENHLSKFCDFEEILYDGKSYYYRVTKTKDVSSAESDQNEGD